MKKLLFSIFSSFSFICYLSAQCSGLQINGYNSDNPDQIRLLATANIPGGTVFFLTDNEWDGTSFNSGENIISWTAPAGGVASGSTILLSGTTATCGTSSGTVLPLSTGDEEIYITSVNPSGTVNVTNICHAVVFGDGTSSSSIAGIPGAIDNGNFDNWDGTTTSDNIVSIPASCTLLPIDLVSFGVKNINIATTLLTFTTASERDNAYFSIERSNDGATFTEIGRVTGSGTTNEKQDYTYTDAQPLKGINYYRLRQVDFDGTSAYSGVVSVMMGHTTTFVVSPSPAADLLKVRFEEPTNEAGRYEIYDQMGRLVLTGEVSAESIELNLEVNVLTTGTYVLRVTNGRQTVTEQFRKL